jgi:hypothetical protein|tara:strand:- start:257 stop:601 length:345 start_codon:yes stop_codon:yes gene_type:complete
MTVDEKILQNIPRKKEKPKKKIISREIMTSDGKIQLQSSMDGGVTWKNTGQSYDKYKPGKDLTGERSGRLSESERKIISKALNKDNPLTRKKGGIVKRYKGGLMVKPKAAKRGY